MDEMMLQWRVGVWAGVLRLEGRTLQAEVIIYRERRDEQWSGWVEVHGERTWGLKWKKRHRDDQRNLVFIVKRVGYPCNWWLCASSSLLLVPRFPLSCSSNQWLVCELCQDQIQAKGCKESLHMVRICTKKAPFFCYMSAHVVAILWPWELQAWG